MEYISLSPKQFIQIEEIVTIHYFEYMSDFSFPGETHDFWEFLCVDKGIVNVVADDQYYTLKKDEVIFHKPNEFHDVNANGYVAPNLVVISFVCHSPNMEFFKNKIMAYSEAERQILAQIISEARNAYANQLSDPYYPKLIRADTVPYGSEQLIKNYLEQFLIQLYRKNNIIEIEKRSVPKEQRGKYDKNKFDEISTYLENSVKRHLTIERICKDNLIGRSQLLKLFRVEANCGVIDYFNKLKIETAKQLIRDHKLNFTQISDYLGYTSIHYFSRQFRKITGMSPSEYSSSIKSLSEKKKSSEDDSE